jgi:hypothetical protein
MTTSSSPPPALTRTTRFLLACGVIGPALFILAFLAEDATRPGYSPLRNMVSALSLSDQGWEQIASFLLCGTLAFGFAVGLRPVLRSGPGAGWGPGLLAVFGLSLIIAGLFVTDPAMGYPPGNAGSIQTLHGTIHGVNAPVAFGSLTAAILVFARRFARDPAWRGWAWYSFATATFLIGSFIASLAAAVLGQNGALPNAPAGLLERLAITVGWSWIALLALRLLREARSPAPAVGVRPSS